MKITRLEMFAVFMLAASVFCTSMSVVVTAQQPVRVNLPTTQLSNRSEHHVTVDGIEYVLIVTPVQCQSQQSQDCTPYMAAPRKANVIVQRIAQVECKTDWCRDEDWAAWILKKVKK